MKYPTSLRIAFQSSEVDTSEPLRERLRLAVRGESCRDIGDRTVTHPETVRRYLSNGTPSADFVRRIADAYGISAEWLLCGRGQALRRDLLNTSLKSATFPQLLEALGDRLGSLDAALRASAAISPRDDRQFEIKSGPSAESKQNRDFSDRQFLHSRST